MSLSEKQKIIIALLADGKFHSGNELADALNISRSGVWKHLQGLAELGLHYAAVNGKGYRLDRPLQLLNHAEILTAMNTKSRNVIASLDLLGQITSTNTYLSQLSLAGVPSGTACLAEQQTAGKGRRGRQWVSPYGHNIYLSILWRFQTSPMAISGLSLAVGVAVMRALKLHFPQQFSLKWPNDIYYQGKKLGGILVEVSGESEGPCTAIVGLGVNLYLPDDAAEPIDQAWTDLTQITGQPVLCRNQLAATLLNELAAILSEYHVQNISAYLDEWRQYDCLKDQTATLFIGQHSYVGKVKGIDNQGLLILAYPDGSTQAFASGEVSFNKNCV